MKYIGFGLVLLLCACTENQPQYQLVRPNEEGRTVLVEEFSGARCPNCPQGTLELENLKSIYGDRLVILTIHAGDFAFKYTDSKFDFTTSGGDELLQLLGNPIGYPSAVINRKKDVANYQVFSSKWGSLISAALEQPTVVALNADLNYDATTRSLIAQFTILPQVDLTGELRLSVMIKEDDISDPQADRAASTGVVSDYTHKNVLRATLSDASGDLLLMNPRAFDPITKTYTFTLPEMNGWWKDKDCSLVAFVTQHTGDNMEVVQVLEAPLIP